MIRVRRRWLALGATAVVVLPLAWLWRGSLLPDTYDMAAMGYHDWGGGPAAHAHAAHQGTPVAELDSDRLAGTAGRVPDVVETLTVREDGGRFTVNGSTPGPLLRVTQGDLVEVTLVNEDVADGATLHWHGLDVPNAADGVAGVTQDAVLPGERFTYRFLADQVGTYWYHSHQVSHEQVLGGLLGALVIDPPPPDPTAPDLDETVVLHQYGARSTLNGEEGTATVAAEPGDRARIRVVNTDNGLSTAWVRGAAYEVLAVDGVDLHEPEPVEGKAVEVPAGGRVDLGITVPATGVRVDFAGTTALVLHADPAGGDSGTAPTEVLDLLDYGTPAPLPFDPDAAARRFDYVIDRRPGFLDGRPGLWWTINGGIFPDVPMYMVEEGDVVVFEIANSSGDTHPMHLHGHHAVVLSRDGQAATGSPWWVDSLEVGVGETYEIAFLADNPGLWMDHCHNLPHATEGLVSHLMYAGVTSSFRVGTERDNQPE